MAGPRPHGGGGGRVRRGPGPQVRGPSGPVVLAPPPSTALLREWSVVCDGPGVSAVLAGWERPGDRRTSDRRRQFEALWSADPKVVRDAALTGLSLAVEHGGDRWAAVAEQLPPVVDDPAGALRRATSLTNRIVAYL